MKALNFLPWHLKNVIFRLEWVIKIFNCFCDRTYSALWEISTFFKVNFMTGPLARVKVKFFQVRIFFHELVSFPGFLGAFCGFHIGFLGASWGLPGGFLGAIFYRKFMAARLVAALKVVTKSIHRIPKVNKIQRIPCWTTPNSCNKITKTWIQISRQNWNYFFSNISHQMMIWLTPFQ